MFWASIGDAFKYSNECSPSIDSKTSLYDFITQKARESLPNDERKRRILLQMAEMWGAFVGSPIQRQSLKFFWLEQTIEGENPFVAETYYKILHRIAEPALARADVRFKSVVAGIISENDRVVLDLESGDRLNCDEVVVTAPLGWLKRNRSVFSPPLPPRLSESIDNIGYGKLDKVYITFPSAFWNIASPSWQPPRQHNSRKSSRPRVTRSLILRQQQHRYINLLVKLPKHKRVIQDLPTGFIQTMPRTPTHENGTCRE